MRNNPCIIVNDKNEYLVTKWGGAFYAASYFKGPWSATEFNYRKLAADYISRKGWDPSRLAIISYSDCAPIPEEAP